MVYTQMGLTAKLFLPALPPFTALVQLPHDSCLSEEHSELHGALCAATEFRLYQDENMIVLNSGITIIATSRSNPSICEVYAKGSGNHTSGLFYLPSLGSLRVGL